MKTVLILLSVILLSGCATRIETATWLGTKPGDPVKRTVVKHTWWTSWLPAFAPMDAHFKDGEFEIITKAVDLPDFPIGTLFDND